jgi:hypothetical protein
MLKTMRNLVSTLAAAGSVAAALLAFGPTAAAEPTLGVQSTPFEVCSPLGCDRQFVIGNAGKWGSVEATGVNRSTESELLVRTELVDAGGVVTRGPLFSVQRVPADFDQQTRTVNETIQGTFVEVRVSACAVSLGTCNTSTYQLS